MPEPNKDSRGVFVSLGDPSPGSVGSRVTGRLVFGLIVCALGAFWTLDNLNILESEPILRWWPLLLVLFGLARLSGVGARRQPVAGTVFTLAGLLLLGNELELLNVRIWEFWPVALILVGSMLVVRSLRGPAAVAAGGDGADRFDQVSTFAMWAGSTIKNESPQFRGGDASAVMGGVELDLRGARPAGPQVVLDVFAWWGGVDIMVPRDWRVVSEVMPFMGGYEDKSRPVEGEVATTLVLRGVVIMGGVEVKN